MDLLQIVWKVKINIQTENVSSVVGAKRTFLRGVKMQTSFQVLEIEMTSTQ